MRDQKHLSAAQIAEALHLDERTVGKWIDCPTYQPRARAKRPSKLDPYKGMVVRLLALSPHAAEYYQRLAEKRGNPRHHVQKIVALSEIYGPEKVPRALEDAWAYQAFSCEYIANLLEQQARPPVQPGALHLTRQQDLLDLELPAPELSLYQSPEGGAA